MPKLLISLIYAVFVFMWLGVLAHGYLTLNDRSISFDWRVARTVPPILVLTFLHVFVHAYFKK